MSSDVFIVSGVSDATAPLAIRQVIQLAGVSPSRVQDAVFGVDGSYALPDMQPIVRDSGLSCPAASVLTSLRAIFFAAASMLSDDTELSVVIGLGSDASTAFVLASPEAVGRMNLLPRARIAARSLAGPEPALQAAGVTAADIEITKSGEQAGSLLHELMDELEAKACRWGMLQVGTALILVERV